MLRELRGENYFRFRLVRVKDLHSQEREAVPVFVHRWFVMAPRPGGFYESMRSVTDDRRERPMNFELCCYDILFHQWDEEKAAHHILFLNRP